jgi:DNA-binding transcriptional MerR regulator
LTVTDEITYSVTHVSKAIGKTPQTVRDWSGRYSGHLSESAKAPKGQERRFTDADVTLLQTVARLSDQGQKHKNILPMIASGYEIPPETDETPPEGETTALAKQNEFTRLMDAIEAEVKARVDAEKRAAAAEARLDMIWRRHWWQLWRPERPQDAD